MKEVYIGKKMQHLHKFEYIALFTQFSVDIL